MRKERSPVPVVLELLAFCLGAAVSLATSYLLVTRLERIGERLGLSEALLGLLAALAADAPEITSAVTALAQHQQKVGAGVIIGSNVFNLAALLGLGAVVAGRIALHRKVVLLGGVVGLWVAVICLVTTTGTIPPAGGLVAVLAVLVPYGILLGAGRARLGRLPVARRWAGWLAVAIHEEEEELEEVIHPPHGRRADVLVGAAALVAVVAASVVMEQAATSLGAHFGVPQIVTGGVVLAAVTSLPNAVAAVYLAIRGRGAAMLSTTLNSNTLNVTAGLLLPGTITGLGPPSAHSVLIAVWYLGLTAAAVGVACRDSGVRRATGALIIGSYLVFLGSLLATAQTAAPGLRLTLGPLLVTAAAWIAGLVRRPAGRTRRAGPPPGTAPPAGDPLASDSAAPHQSSGATDTSEENRS
jgi:cation:H+ antiporter